MNEKVNAEYLIKIQRHINETKTNIDRLTGRLEAAYAGLKELGFDSIEEAEKEIESLETSIEKLGNEFRGVVEQINGLYEKTKEWR